jgi:hypothetical protein
MAAGSAAFDHTSPPSLIFIALRAMVLLTSFPLYDHLLGILLPDHIVTRSLTYVSGRQAYTSRGNNGRRHIHQFVLSVVVQEDLSDLQYQYFAVLQLKSGFFVGFVPYDLRSQDFTQVTGR